MHTLTTDAEERRYAELQLLALDFARNGDTESLAPMLRHGLPANLADHKGNTMLMLACYHGHHHTARLLLEHGAEVDRRNDRGQTPLAGAAFHGDSGVIALLLQHGADANADNGAGMTPIMFAALLSHTRVVEQLRQSGGSLQRRNRLGISAQWMLRLSRAVRLLLGRPRKGRVMHA